MNCRPLNGFFLDRITLPPQPPKGAGFYPIFTRWQTLQRNPGEEDAVRFYRRPCTVSEFVEIAKDVACSALSREATARRVDHAKLAEVSAINALRLSGHKRMHLAAALDRVRVDG